MNAGAPDSSILTCRAFPTHHMAFPGFRGFDAKTGIDGPTTGAPHVDFIPADRRMLFHATKHRHSSNLPADLGRIEFRRHIEKS